MAFCKFCGKKLEEGQKCNCEEAVNADNNSSMDYGSFLGRDAEGNLVLKVPSVRNPGRKAKQYAQPNGDIVIPNVGRDGKVLDGHLRACFLQR